MSLKLTFSKVAILSVYRTPGAGTVKVSCAPTKTVAKAMGWDDFPEWQKKGSPAGKLDASLVEFTPANADQGKFAFDLATTLVNGFEFVRKQVKKGQAAKKAPTFKTELHCSIDFSDATGAKKLEAYMSTVLESSMRVTYEPEPEQSELPLSDDSQTEFNEVRKKATAKEED
jgi:hypothetical protein